MWYQKSYRRHLCDMHIDDWNPEFLSKFSPKKYVKNLKKAKINSAMLYFQSHVGLCYYPTKVGKMHAGFVGKEDAMRQLVDLCHDEGIFVTGYYSLIYNTSEHDRHPEWRMVNENGLSRRERAEAGDDAEFTDNQKAARYGFCCPNNADYRAFVAEQIHEMAEYFPTVDGMFYDMLFWPHMCYCNSCKARWAREVGGELPTVEDWKDEKWLLHMQKRREWMGEFAQWATDLTKSLLPHVSVEHNVAYSALPKSTTANCEEVLNACDYAGGDLYRDIYSQSFACKFYRSVTKNQPFEYMFSRCAPKLSAHTQIKSLDVMRSTAFLTAAHHGATLVIDAIDPVGTMDERVYDQIGTVFDEMIPYEAEFDGEMLADVGLYYSLKSKFNPNHEQYLNYFGCTVTTETMIGAHIPFAITGGFAPLDRYPIVIASCLTEEDAYDNERLISYVENGGTLYLSGGECQSLLKSFFDAKVTGRTEENAVYIAPGEAAQEAFEYFNRDYPMPFDGTAPIATGIDPTCVLATVTLPYTRQGIKEFASIHSNPPGIKSDIPALAMKKIGRGTVIWSALLIECLELYDYRRVLLNLLRFASKFTPSVISDAPDDVEITVFEKENGILLHTIQLSSKHTARRIPDFEITLTNAKEPVAVYQLPERKPVCSHYDNGRLTISVHDPKIFQTYEIRYKK